MRKARLIKRLFFSVLIIVLIGGCTGYNQYKSIISVDVSPVEGKYRGTAAQVDRRLILTAQKTEGLTYYLCRAVSREGIGT